MRILTDREIDALDTVANKLPLKDKLGDFNNASAKLRFGTSGFNTTESDFNCDYTLKWFKSHKEPAIELIARYQKAAKKAMAIFWKMREEA